MIEIIGIVIAGLTFFGGLIAVLYKLVRSVDRSSEAIARFEKKQDAQWGKIDEQSACLETHGNRLVALETKTEIFEKRLEARA